MSNTSLVSKCRVSFFLQKQRVGLWGKGERGFHKSKRKGLVLLYIFMFLLRTKQESKASNKKIPLADSIPSDEDEDIPSDSDTENK